MSAVDPVAAMHEKWARMLGVTSSTSASDVQMALECAECDEVVCLAGSCSSSSVCLEATYDATRNLPTTEASVVCAEPLLSTLLTSDLSSSEQDAVTSASEPSQSQTTSTNDRDAEQEIEPCKFPASRSHTTSHIVASDTESQHERSETLNCEREQVGEIQDTPEKSIVVDKDTNHGTELSRDLNPQLNADACNNSGSDREPCNSTQRRRFLFEPSIASIDLSSSMEVPFQELFQRCVSELLARSGSKLLRLRMSGVHVNDAMIRALADSAPNLRRVALVSH